MKILNHIYVNHAALGEFIAANGIKKYENILIQIFTGVSEEKLLEDIAGELKGVLPLSSLIGVSTAGEIVEGKMHENEIVISFSLFEATKVRSKLYIGQNEQECARKLIGDLVAEDTKVIIIFSDGIYSNGDEILRHISLLRPDITIAGGRAGDYNRFEKTVVFDETGITQKGVVAASLSGEKLKIHNSFMLNWDSIGEEMFVTKAQKNRLYTINNQKAIDIYEKYLGKEISDFLPESGIEFPLIINREGIDVARAPIAKLDDDSLLFGGNIYEGERVRFGFGNVDMMRIKSFDSVKEFESVPAEAIYIYSCSARKAFLGKELEDEFAVLQGISQTAGFFTYGEYFHSSDINELLNITTTFLSLSERADAPHREQHESLKKISGANRTLNALSHLASVTSKELSKIQDSLKDGQRIAKFGIWEWDIKNNRLWWSDGIYIIFGLKPQEFEATYECFEGNIHPDDRQKVRDAVQSALNKEKEYFITHRIIRSDTKEMRYVKEQGEVDFDEEGKPVFMKGTVQDITELEKTRMELEEYKNSLEKQVREEIEKRREQEIMLMQQSRLAGMGEMIGNIAHQWRQPLNALSLVVGNVKDAYDFGRLDDEYIQRAYLKANRLIQKMSTTIDDFRDFFKPDKQKSKFNLKDAIDDSLSLLEAVLKHNNIEIEKRYEEIDIEGFHNEFSQVILNVLNNAKDALIEKKTVYPEIEIESNSDKDSVSVIIRDNAGGMPDDVLTRVFEPYFTTKEQGKGTGIGLYMSKIIIEDHMRGKIRAYNHLGSHNETTGAVFEIRIPKR